jgi:hypothetical protein
MTGVILRVRKCKNGLKMSQNEFILYIGGINGGEQEHRRSVIQ